MKSPDIEAFRGIANSIRVRCATTANITILSALNSGDTLDGVTLANGDLVLVKDQSAPAENGVYVVAVQPGRYVDFSALIRGLTGAYDMHAALQVTVEEGTANADTTWLCTSNRGGALGTTALAFAQMLQANGKAATPPAFTELTGTSVDNTVPRFNGTGGAQQTSGVTIADTDIVVATAFGTQVSTVMADDTAISISIPLVASGTPSAIIAICTSTNTASGNPRGVFGANGASGGAAINSLAMVSTTGIIFTTGILAGTTSTDVNFTISVHTDGKLYLENRTGASRRISVCFFAPC